MNSKQLASRRMPPSSPRSQRSTTEIQNLYNVINSTTPDRLRTLLKDLSTTAPANFVYVQGELMLQPGALKRAWSENDEDEQDEEDGEDGEDDSDDTSEDAGHDHESDYSDEQTNAPASRQRFEICGQCNEEYDVLLNDKKSCERHDGTLHTPYKARAYTERCQSAHDAQAGTGA